MTALAYAVHETLVRDQGVKPDTGLGLTSEQYAKQLIKESNNG
jgi:hypothetical protein